MPKRRHLRSESGTQRYLGGPFKDLSWKHSCWNAVEGPLSNERHSSIYIYILVYINVAIDIDIYRV